MLNVYIYKMTVDNSGAPCIWNNVLSLAICKPAIRSSAPEGSVILGFAANDLYANNALVYAATVTSRIEDGKYFTLPQFRGRPDSIYRRVNGRFEWRRDAKFHSATDLRRDLGLHPEYKRAHVLISKGQKNFRYFGGDCPLDYKVRFPLTKRLIENLGQGHRVNISADLRKEIEELVRNVFQTKSPYRRIPISGEHCGDSRPREDDAFQMVRC